MLTHQFSPAHQIHKIRRDRLGVNPCGTLWWFVLQHSAFPGQVPPTSQVCQQSIAARPILRPKTRPSSCHCRAGKGVGAESPSHADHSPGNLSGGGRSGVGSENSSLVTTPASQALYSSPLFTPNQLFAEGGEPVPPHSDIPDLVQLERAVPLECSSSISSSAPAASNTKQVTPGTDAVTHAAAQAAHPTAPHAAHHSAAHSATPMTSTSDVAAPRTGVASVLGLPKSLQLWASSITTEFVHRREPLAHAADLQHTHYTRETLTFPSHGVTCEAWLYLPTEESLKALRASLMGSSSSSSGSDNRSCSSSSSSPPVVIMGHGLGSQKDMGLHPYAEQFAMAGMAVFVFDYRTYGGSEGMPRHVLSWRMYTQDWQAALDFVTSSSGLLSNRLDTSRVALWGESYSGGHVLVTAANNPAAIKAIVSAEPYLTARGALKRAVLERGPVKVAATLSVALYDQARQSLGLSPAYLKLIGGVEELSLLQLSAEDMSTVEKNPVRQGGWRNLGTASFLLSAPFYHPVDKITSVHCPTLFIAGTLDHICPADTVKAAAAKMKPGLATVIERPEGHLQLHRNGAAAEALQPVIEFLQKHLGLGGHAGQSIEVAPDEAGVGQPTKETPYG